MDEESSKAAPLPEHLAIKAEKELNEIAKTRDEDIRAFRETVKAQKDLRSRTDDNFLLRFLRARKFDQRRALELLRNYYKQKAKYADLCRDMQASHIPEMLAEPIQGILPDRDSEGRVILVFTNLSRWNPSTTPLEDLMIYFILSMECAIEDEETQINGLVLLQDPTEFQLKHFTCFTLPKIYKFISLTFNSFPVRIKQIHIVRAPWYYKAIYYTMKPFLSKKIKDRIIFHGYDLSEFHKQMSVDVLPEDFGGTLGKFSNTEWNKKLLEFDRVMKKNATFGFV